MPRKGILERFIIFSTFLSLRKMKECLPWNALLPSSILEKNIEMETEIRGEREEREG